MLRAAEIERLFGSRRLPASGTLRASRLTIEWPARPGEELVLKAAGRDDAGRAVAAWCTLSRDRPARREPLSVATESRSIR